MQPAEQKFGNILAGAAITEVIFGRAGLVSFLATSISTKNIPVVQGAIVVIGVAYVANQFGHRRDRRRR